MFAHQGRWENLFDLVLTLTACRNKNWFVTLLTKRTLPIQLSFPSQHHWRSNSATEHICLWFSRLYFGPQNSPAASKVPRYCMADIQNIWIKCSASRRLSYPLQWGDFTWIRASEKINYCKRFWPRIRSQLDSKNEDTILLFFCYTIIFDVLLL